MFKRFQLLFSISQSNLIVRRYFVVNGFDGALTMLGLLMGFHVSNNVILSVVITACMGTAIALTVSGISSAYISESAEKRQELRELEDAMIAALAAIGPWSGSPSHALYCCRGQRACHLSFLH